MQCLERGRLSKKAGLNKMIKVKAYANYGFCGTDMEFEEEFEDDVLDEEIEKTMAELVMSQIDWNWEKV